MVGTVLHIHTFEQPWGITHCGGHCTSGDNTLWGGGGGTDCTSGDNTLWGGLYIQGITTMPLQMLQAVNSHITELQGKKAEPMDVLEILPVQLFFGERTCGALYGRG